MEKNIIILGAGFGGVTAAIKLSSYQSHLANYRIILVDKNSYQLYTPALYEVAAITKHDASSTALQHAITIALSDILENRRVVFMQSEVTSLDIKEKLVKFKDGRALNYEFLVVASGSETNYFGIPGLKEYSHPLKTFDDGIRLRDNIEKLIAEKTGTMHVVVGGAGATGVELASEFINFICQLQKIYNKESVCRIEVILVEAGSGILPGFAPWIAVKAKQHLQKIGVAIKTNTCITEVNANEILTNTGPMHYDLLVWAGGVCGPSFLESFGLRLNKKRQIAVNEYLEAADGVFAIGDNAAFPAKNGKMLPNNVPVAEDQARTTALNIVRMAEYRQKKPYKPHERYPYILAIGKKYAIADLVIIHFSGMLGWLLKQLVELRYLLFILPPKKAISTWIYAIKLYSSNDV